MENSEALNWSMDLTIGNREIDNEHIKLYEIYQELIEFVQTMEHVVSLPKFFQK